MLAIADAKLDTREMGAEGTSPERNVFFNTTDVIVTGLRGTGFLGLFDRLTDDAKQTARTGRSLAETVQYIQEEPHPVNRSGLVVVLPRNRNEWMELLSDDATASDDLRALQELVASDIPVIFVVGDSDFQVLDMTYAVKHGGQPHGRQWDTVIDDLLTNPPEEV